MISDLKDLKSLLKLCRQQGITEIKLNGVEIKFGDLPQEQRSGSLIQGDEDIKDPWANFPVGELTPDQLMFYSSGGRPEDDPALNNKETA